MPSAPFAIRRYRPGDEIEMAQIYFDAARQIGARAYSPEQLAAWAPAIPDPVGFARKASDGRVTLVAVEAPDGPLIAFGDVEPDGHIDFLYCRPDRAGRGIASALIDALLAGARSRGIAQFHVEASELARPLFERKAFALVERRDFEIRGVPIHNFRMVRSD